MPEEQEKKILNKLVQGAGITVIGMFFSKFLTYFYRLAVARIGPDAYGQLSQGLVIIGIMGTLSKFGFDEAIRKFIPEAREEENRAKIKGIVWDSVKFISVTSLSLGAAVFLLSDHIAVLLFESPETAPIIRVFAAVPFFSKIASIFLDVTLGFNTTKYKVLTVRVAQNIIQLSVTLLMIYLNFGVLGAAYGWLAGIIASLPIALYFMEKNFGPILTSDVKPKKMYNRMLKFSYPLIFSGIVGTALGWGDTALLGYFMDDATVGFYNAAYPTALLIVLPAQAISSLALSSFSELGAKGHGQVKALKTTTRWVFSMSFPAFLIMALFSDQMMHLLFGKQYAVTGTALTILAFGNLIGTTTGQTGAYLKSNNRTKIIAYNSTINLMLNMALNLVLIPLIGMVGAAIATAVSSVLMNILVLTELYRYDGTHPFSKEMIRPVIAGTISITVTYLVFSQIFQTTPYWALIPAGAVFGTTYSLIFLKSGGLKPYDKEIIVTAARKIGLEKQARKTIEILT
mgnify:CR=1 FL=1